MDDHQQQQPESRTFSEETYSLQPLTRQVIGESFMVFRAFGYVFLESVYRRAEAEAIHIEADGSLQVVHAEERHGLLNVGVNGRWRAPNAVG